MNLNELFESVRPAYLYHATTLERAYHIITENCIRGKTWHSYSDLYPHSFDSNDVSGVSLTRNKDFDKIYDKDCQVMFILDQNKLRQKYKIVPVDYFHDQSDLKDKFRSESEEFVVGNINNLSSYIVGIKFTKKWENALTNQKWVSANLNDFDTAARNIVINNPQYIGKPISNQVETLQKTVNESSGTIETYWFNVKTKQKVICTSKYHSLDVAKHPENYGLTKEQVGIHNKSDMDEKILRLMFQNNWVRCAWFPKLKIHFDVSCNTILNARIALADAIKNYPINNCAIDIFAIPVSTKALYLGNTTSINLQNENEINSFIKYGKVIPKKVSESAGRIVTGVNTPPGITADHITKMGKRMRFNINRSGYPPVLLSNGKINKITPKNKDYSKLDKQSFFDSPPDLTYWTDGKTKDMV